MDELQTGLALGRAAGGGLCSLGERAAALEVGVGSLLGTAVHGHDLALGGRQAGHGARVAHVTVGATPFASVEPTAGATAAVPKVTVVSEASPPQAPPAAPKPALYRIFLKLHRIRIGQQWFRPLLEPSVSSILLFLI